MDERRQLSQWRRLVAGLGVAHFLILMAIGYCFTPGVYSGPRSLFYEPPWLYHVFMYVFGFPVIPVSRLTHLLPGHALIVALLIVPTCLLWGCIWAEPFRRRYGWQPWRFSIRDLLIATTFVAVLLGTLVILSK